MERKNLKREQGQIIVILALALVALLGFTALAVDVGMAFSDRRNDQNVADSIALAGAQAAARYAIEVYKTDASGYQGTTASLVCPDTSWRSSDDPGTGNWVKAAMHDAFLAALARGIANGYPDVGDGGDRGSVTNLESSQHGIYVECIPVQDQYGNYTQKEGIYTHAMISSNTSASFAHFVFGGQLRNTVTAISRAQPFMSFYTGAAIVSLDKYNCSNGGNNGGGTWFDGDVNVKLNGGGAHSNSCMDKNGQGSGEIQLIGSPPPAAVYNSGSSACATFQQIDPVLGTEEDYCTEPTTNLIPRIPYPAPACYANDMQDRTYDKNSDTMLHGRYNSDVIITGKGAKNEFHITMEPGLYCFYGDFRATSKPTADGSTLTGNGITIYMAGPTSSFSMEGSAVFTLSAADKIHPPANHAMQGMLVLYRYTPTAPVDCMNANTSELKMEGGSGAIYVGTVYAPCSQIDFGGNSSMTDSTAQLIGNTIKIHGSPETDITYDASKMAILSPLVGLQK